MTSVAARVAVCAGDPESVTVTVKELVPAVVGVPDKTPAVLKVRPAGSVPVDTVQLKGAVPPDAVRVRLYAVLTAPGVRGEVVVMVSVAGGVGGVGLLPPPPQPVKRVDTKTPHRRTNLFNRIFDPTSER